LETLKNNLPIGIFDSGVGGLTVYRALHRRLPDERFLYLGDTARVPYGTKSLSTVERYGIENARFLSAQGIKMLVVACNTASALALPAIERAAGVPTVGVIESGARAAVEAAHAKIGVIATEATVRSGAYRRAIKKLAPQIKVIEQACPLFVSLAEEGYADSDAARLVAQDYLSGLRDEETETLVLGCTHYPVLRSVISEVVGEGVRLIDSGEAVATDVAAALAERGLQRPPAPQKGARPRQLCDDLDHFYVTDAAERFSRIAEMFLGRAPRRLEAVEVWGHDELNVRR